MKRFHVHVHVADLAASIAFYNKLFGALPARTEGDYAKWMLDDPRINFAISTRGGGHTGVDHLGFQADDATELAELRARADAADAPVLDEGNTTCCYARSDKHWVTDPQGLAWEQFHTLENIPVFREAAPAEAAGACCTPAAQKVGAATAMAAPVSASSASAASSGTSCCGPAAPATVQAVTTPRGKPLGIPVKAGGCC